MSLQRLANPIRDFTVMVGIRQEDCGAFEEAIQFVELRLDVLSEVNGLFRFSIQRFNQSHLLRDVVRRLGVRTVAQDKSSPRLDFISDEFR